MCWNSTCHDHNQPLWRPCLAGAMVMDMVMVKVTVTVTVTVMVYSFSNNEESE